MTKNDRPLDVVTGGAGFIGSHLADLLLSRGRSVRIVDDLSSGSRRNVPEEAEFLEGDLVDLAEEAVRGADVVYHMAAIPSVPFSFRHPVASHRSIVDTTIAVLDASERAGVRRVVLAGSSAVYGDSAFLPRKEDHPLRPQSPYALDKLAAEMYLRHWAERGRLQTVSLRFFNVYGPRQDPRSMYAAVVPIFVEAVQSGDPVPIFGDGHQSRDFTYVGDVVRGMFAAGMAERLFSPVYNIASGRPTTVLELAHAVGAVAGRDVRIDHGPRRPGDVVHSWANVVQAKIDLGFTAETKIDAGIRATVEWSRRQVKAGTAANG